MLKQLREQNQSLIFATKFKDDVDTNDNVPPAHAILIDHTALGISYLLGNVIHSVKKVNAEPIPLFIIIDFSSALMNAVLQQFNIETIKNRLNRCWNATQGKYNTAEIRECSSIHLCCCHLMHPIARSTNTVHIEENLRQAIVYIFAYMLCSNDINQLYDTLGLVIDVSSDPAQQRAEENLEKLMSLQLNVDEESESTLKDGKKISKRVKKQNDELEIVDEYF